MKQCYLSVPTQYQVPQTQGSSGGDSQQTASPQPTQNGETPHSASIKTTTIVIESRPSDTTQPPTSNSNSNSNNSSSSSSSSSNSSNSVAEEARRRGLPISVVQFLADMPEPVRAPTDAEVVHTGQEEAEEWERRKTWREERRREVEGEVSRVQGLLSDLSAHTKDKPSDTAQ